MAAETRPDARRGRQIWWSIRETAKPGEYIDDFKELKLKTGARERGGAALGLHLLIGVSPQWIEEFGDLHDPRNPRLDDLFREVKSFSESLIGGVYAMRIDLDERGGGTVDVYAAPTFERLARPRKDGSRARPTMEISVKKALLNLQKRAGGGKSFAALQTLWADHARRHLDVRIIRGVPRKITGRDHYAVPEFRQLMEEARALRDQRQGEMATVYETLRYTGDAQEEVRLRNDILVERFRRIEQQERDAAERSADLHQLMLSREALISEREQTLHKDQESLYHRAADLDALELRIVEDDRSNRERQHQVDRQLSKEHQNLAESKKILTAEQDELVAQRDKLQRISVAVSSKMNTAKRLAKNVKRILAPERTRLGARASVLARQAEQLSRVSRHIVSQELEVEAQRRLIEVERAEARGSRALLEWDQADLIKREAHNDERESALTLTRRNLEQQTREFEDESRRVAQDKRLLDERLQASDQQRKLLEAQEQGIELEKEALSAKQERLEGIRAAVAFRSRDVRRLAADAKKAFAPERAKLAIEKRLVQDERLQFETERNDLIALRAEVVEQYDDLDARKRSLEHEKGMLESRGRKLAENEAAVRLRSEQLALREEKTKLLLAAEESRVNVLARKLENDERGMLEDLRRREQETMAERLRTGLERKDLKQLAARLETQRRSLVEGISAHAEAEMELEVVKHGLLKGVTAIASGTITSRSDIDSKPEMRPAVADGLIQLLISVQAARKSATLAAEAREQAAAEAEVRASEREVAALDRERQARNVVRSVSDLLVSLRGTLSILPAAVRKAYDAFTRAKENFPSTPRGSSIER